MQESMFTKHLLQIEERFEEMDSDLTVALPERDEKYAALRAKLTELDQEHAYIEAVLDGEGAVCLNAEEHATLVEYVRTTDEAENRERLNLYFAGHRDCIAYLRRIGIL